MPDLGIDYSFARIDPHAIAGAGFKVVFRYLANPPAAGQSWGKIIQKPEYDALVGAGLKVYLNWETWATRPLDGASGGDSDGRVANLLADGLGYAKTDPIYFSLDTDDRAHPDWADATEAYLRAAKAHGRPVGIYGSVRVVNEMHARGAADTFWQACAWSGQDVSPIADFYQRTGHSVRIPGVDDNAYDEDVVLRALVPTPPPAPQAAQDGGLPMTVNVKSALVNTSNYGFGQFVGIVDFASPISGLTATVHGPDPKPADPSSTDDFWPGTIGATVRAQVRGTKVVVTISAPNWKAGMATPQAHVTVFI